jgi:riboflavin synthase
MFTGIITQLGTCTERSANSLKLDCSEELAGSLAIGSSIAVNGVCLTVTELAESSFAADVMAETWQRTALGQLKASDMVNLELPLGADGRFDGHIVQGHVDGTGKIASIKPDGNSRLFTIAAPQDLTRYMIDKGSVTLNGISLTVINVANDQFSVGIIPHTYTHTMLQQAAVGDAVNIEVDIMAKYFMKFIKEQTDEKS